MSERGVATLPGSPRRPSTVRLLLVALLVWVGEAAIGLVPLLAHYGIAWGAKLTEHEALCTADMHCRLLPDTPYAEISILAVVTAGVSAIASLGFGHHPRQTSPDGLTFCLFFLSLFACLLGIGMYVVATVGILNPAVTWATWATLLASLIASLLLSLERGVR